MWLDGFEEFLSEVKTKWKGVIFLTGDTNIDLPDEPEESNKQNQNILRSFNLQQQVTMATRKGYSLTEIICSNIPDKLVRTNVLNQ